MSLVPRIGTAVSATIQIAERVLCFNMLIAGILREITTVNIAGSFSPPNKRSLNILTSNIRNKILTSNFSFSCWQDTRGGWNNVFSVLQRGIKTLVVFPLRDLSPFLQSCCQEAHWQQAHGISVQMWLLWQALSHPSCHVRARQKTSWIMNKLCKIPTVVSFHCSCVNAE